MSSLLASFGKFASEALGEQVFTEVLKRIFSKITEKGLEKVEKRVEKILGFNLEEAKKDVSDEIVYSIAVNALNDERKEAEIDAFEERLRRESPQKAESLILFVAKMVMRFECEIKETTNPKTGPRIEKIVKDLKEGIGYAKKFLESLLRNIGIDEEETFRKRVAFLQGRNVFSLIKEKKGESEFVKRIRELLPVGKEILIDKINKVFSNLKEESASFSKDCRLFRENARVFRKKAKGGRS